MTNTIISGNIITDFSDHFSQFKPVQRPKFNYKKTTIYKRDYSSFSEQSPRDDVAMDIEEFNAAFEQVLEKISAENKEIYL